MTSFISIHETHKFGMNASVATVFEPIVDENAIANAFPDAEATTTILSSSTDDDVGGTGALTVEVLGVGDAGHYIMETVALTGQDVVTLANDFRIILRAYVLTAGSGKTNAGRIDIKHGANVIAAIAVGHAQTQILAWYFSDDSTGGEVNTMEMHVASIGSISLDYQLVLLRAGVERVQHIGELTNLNPTDNHEFSVPMAYRPGDLIFMEARVSAGTKAVDGSFGIHMS